MVPGVEKAIVESQLFKYWLEVSHGTDERLEESIDEGGRSEAVAWIPILSPLVRLSRARDEMFLATDTSWARGTMPLRQTRLRAHTPSLIY